MDIDPLARVFARTAAAYERGRPDYPLSAVEWVVQITGLTKGQVVVDLAAGTGKFTRLLRTTGARVLAVEPIAEMRDELRRAIPGIEAVDGSATETAIPTSWVDVVTIAQAFHWFATDEALAEIARILRPGGYLVLIWNRRDNSDPLQAQLTALVEPLRKKSGGESPGGDGKWQAVMEGSDLFTPVAEKHLSYVQQLDRSGLLDRFASVSFIADLPGRRRDQLLARIGAVAPGGPALRGRDAAEAREALEDRYRLAYLTDLHAYRGRS